MLVLDETGSAVLFIVFFLAIFGGAFIYSQLDDVMIGLDDAVDEADFESVGGGDLTDEPGYKLQIWFWQVGILIVGLAGLTIWLLSSLQKARYREE